MRLIAPSLAALCLSAALATPAASQEAPRFAFFSINQLVRTSKKAGAIFSELEITKKNLEEKLGAKGQELQTLQQQLNSPSLDPDKKEALAKKYRDVEFEAKKMQEDSQQEYQRVERKVGEAITKIAAPIVEQLAKEEKLQLVLSDQAISILSWGDAEWLKAFTAEVSKRLDATDAAPAPKPAAAAPKPAAAKPAAPKK
ncbi:MAG: OmpH family outer membrane protein [Geothrix sp.]|uniref:OmpH family outer membrane protein n=1 Tax=Geothrix sp. TaxID=1962974 RepID=UPI001843F727|nr:OmpH family outer membrane protein [Geothrix sp.]NWJ41904.1 OmpH family outer membrane protein [Geothrix sp.]WIL20123.1 MAG: OmpH family outer membrane protein [Geothrix sp.]